MVVVIDRRSVSRLLLVGVVAMLGSATGFAQQIRFAGDRVVVDKLDGEVLHTFVRYHNRPEVWNDVFPVRVNGAKINIAGHYLVSDSSISFIPAFPFARGVDYEATFYSAQLAKNANEVYLPYMNPSTLTLKFKLDATSTAPPSIVAVYPTADALPENLLRFHIEFSSPMTRGELYRRVRIFDEEGKEIEKALLMVDEELWDDDMRSVTVMLDPGRIKRGLRANLEMKAPLIAGQKYKLVIEEGWKNSEGVATTNRIEKKFICYMADRSKPLVTNWQINPPATSHSPLVIKMGGMYDIVLLRKSIVVTDALGNAVNGRLSVAGHESEISFLPDRPWGKDKYTVLVNPKLEDLAGNNLVRLFDRDVMEKAGLEAQVVSSLTFVVGAGL